MILDGKALSTQIRTEIKDHRKQIVLNEKKSRGIIRQLQSQIGRAKKKGEEGGGKG